MHVYNIISGALSVTACTKIYLSSFIMNLYTTEKIQIKIKLINNKISGGKYSTFLLKLNFVKHSMFVAYYLFNSTARIQLIYKMHLI